MEYKPPSLELNLTPMIDVVFLLLIFFMLVSEISSMQTAELSLPYASQAKTDKDKDMSRQLVVNVQESPGSPDGSRIIVAGREHDADSIKCLFRKEAMIAGTSDPATGATNLRLRIRADKDVLMRKMNRVFEACSECKIIRTIFSATKEVPKGVPE
jgi:biopolymer transport protein ExbD